MWLPAFPRSANEPAYEVYDPRYVDGYRGWGQNRYSQYRPEYTEWFSDDGLIVSPILAFVELVWEDPSLHAAYRTKADEYLRVVEEDLIAKWHANWAPDPGWTVDDCSRFGEDAGYHVYEWSGWKRQPLNMFLSFADALVTLRRLSMSPYYKPRNTGFVPFYADQSEQMLRYFHDQLLYETPLDTTRYVDPGAASGSFHYRITAVDYRRPSNEGPPSPVVLMP